MPFEHPVSCRIARNLTFAKLPSNLQQWILHSQAAAPKARDQAAPSSHWWRQLEDPELVHMRRLFILYSLQSLLFSATMIATIATSTSKLSSILLKDVGKIPINFPRIICNYFCCDLLVNTFDKRIDLTERISNLTFHSFCRIDIEIQDTLMRRSVSSDEDPVVHASQRSTEKLSENPTKVSEVELVAPKTLVASHQQIVETTSTAESVQDTHSAEVTPTKVTTDMAWCVTLPSESVLLFDSL
jgi:hypothetical protein